MRPPRLARRLIGWCAPEETRAALLSDLDEEFERDVLPSRGRAAAWVWYWRQVITSVIPLASLPRRPATTSNRRDSRPRAWSRDALRDSRIAMRALVRQPVFAASVIITLAVGVAATTAILTLVHGILLRGLPFADPDRLVSVLERDGQRASQSGNVSYPDFLDYRSQNASFEAMAAHSGGSRTLIDASGRSDRVVMTEVTDGFFAMLGVRLLFGRDFAPADADPNAPAVVILSHAAWRTRFGADPALVGRDIALGPQRARVIGVLPQEFLFPPRGLTDVWLPVRATAAQRERRFTHWLEIIGRVKPGTTAEAAQADLDVIAARFATDDPRYHPATRVEVLPLHERTTAAIRPLLVALLGGAMFLLAIACANIAGLLITRGAGRVRELTVRAAIGAAPSRLVRQLLAESVALALPGALLGLAIGHVAVRVLVASVPRAQRATMPQLDALGLHPVVVAVALTLAGITTLVFGLLPAWQAARRGATAGLRARTGTRPYERRLHATFVVAQMSLALVLIAGAGLMARSVHRLLAVSPGLDPDHLLTLRVTLGGNRYANADVVRAFHREMLDRLQQVPGATAAATVTQLALTGRGNTGTFDVREAPGRPDSSALIRTVSSSYFDAAGISVLAGRTFSGDDRETSPRVVVVNDTAARTLFGGAPIGAHIRFPFFDGQPWWEIVGIVGDEQFIALDAEMAPVVYFPFAQSPASSFTTILRTTGDPAAAADAARAAVAGIDASLPVYQIQTMEEVIASSDAVYRRRLALLLLAVFSGSAVVLAAVGIYGLLAQTLAERRRELGIRAALGATRRQLAGVVVRRGMRLAFAGLALGVVASAFAGRALQSLLFGVGVVDPLSLVASVVLLAGIAAVACLIPSFRALRVDPAVTLRAE